MARRYLGSNEQASSIAEATPARELTDEIDYEERAREAVAKIAALERKVG